MGKWWYRKDQRQKWGPVRKGCEYQAKDFVLYSLGELKALDHCLCLSGSTYTDCVPLSKLLNFSVHLYLSSKMEIFLGWRGTRD